MGAIPSNVEELAVPERVKAGLRALADDLGKAAEDNIVGLALYGGLVRGRYRGGRSDVNIIVVLREADPKALAAIAPVLGAAWRRLRVDPLILTRDELRSVAEEFPVKFWDMRDAHVVLAGEDPFEGLELAAESVRYRIRQELRNLELRLRRRYVLVHDDPEEVSRALARAAVPLAVNLAALLKLEARGSNPRAPAAVFEASSKAYGLDHDVLAALASLRRDESVADPGKVFAGTMLILASLLSRAERPEVGP